MRQKEVFKKIGGIIQELSEQYEYLDTAPDNMNELELELFVANAHFLTDHIEILCKLNLQNNAVKRPVIKQEPTYQQKYFEPMVRQMKHAAGLSEPVQPKSPVKKMEPEKPFIVEKPFVEEPEEQPVAHIDLASDVPEDTYSVMQQEPETTKHEFTLNEAASIEAPGITTLKDVLAASAAKIEEETTAGIVEPRAIEEPAPIEEAVVAEELLVDEPPTRMSETLTEKAPESQQEPIAEEPETEVLPTGPEVEAPAIEPPEQTLSVELMGISNSGSEPLKNGHEEDEIITINDKMSAQLGDKGISKTEQLAIKPISDIKLAITLNDKLLYVKDLFNGYNLAYSEAIEILNRFNTFEEASRFLKTNYVTKNNWESKTATTEKFYALLKRRYA